MKFFLSILLCLISAEPAFAAFESPNLPFTTTEFFRRDDNGTVYRDGFLGISGYKIYRNGLFELGAWKGLCKKDSMTDVFSCIVTDTDNNIGMAFTNMDRPDAICVSIQNYPGKTALIRINDEKPLEAGPTGCLADTSAFDRIVSANKITTRGYVFPSEIPIDKTRSIDHLENVQKLMIYLRDNDGRLNFPAY